MPHGGWVRGGSTASGVSTEIGLSYQAVARGVGAPQAVLLDEDIGEDEAADGSLLAQSTASPCRGHGLLQLPSYPPGTGARDGCG